MWGPSLLSVALVVAVAALFMWMPPIEIHAGAQCPPRSIAGVMEEGPSVVLYVCAHPPMIENTALYAAWRTASFFANVVEKAALIGGRCAAPAREIFNVFADAVK